MTDNEGNNTMITPIKVTAEDGILNDVIYAEDSSIISAISAVMGDIEKLGKTAVNKHANYKYASVDDFLDCVRPLLAKHKLWIQQDEVSQDIRERGESVWLEMVFDFYIRHGSEMIGPSRRTAMVNAKMGAQAYGACQSYALKQYLRATFMIATGEQNLDEGVLEPATLPPRNSRDVRWQGPLTKGLLQEMMKTYISAIENAETLEELESIGDKMAVPADKLPKTGEWGNGMTFSEVVEQCKHDQPGWITGENMPELFIPFNSHMDEALDRLGYNDGETA